MILGGMQVGVIHIVGLGGGSLDALPSGTQSLLFAGYPVYLRTARHPVVDHLRDRALSFCSFDDIYDREETFDAVYATIVETLVNRSKEVEALVYAVPGHPGVAEKTVRLLQQLAKEGKVCIQLGPGQSFLDDLWLRLEIDPVTGFTLLDVDDIQKANFSLRHHLIVVQMYNHEKASEAKLSLAECYGDEHEVVVARAIGIAGEERIDRVKLYELDRIAKIDHLTTLYVPPIADLSKPIGEWSELIGIIEKLRSPDGCPWDMEQTHATLRPFLIEEAYEAVHAIDQADWESLRDELGDVLLQVVLHSQIGQEEGLFSHRDVVRSISEKMIRRHPHVFGDVTVRGVEDVHANWEAIKQAEKQSAQNGMIMNSRLAKVKEGLPPLVESYKLQEVAATLRFDWQDVEQVYEKVQEELTELREAAPSSQQEEWGDLLFALVNVARWLKIDPDEALRAANQKFRRRFLGVEKMLQSNNMDFSTADFEVFMDFWNEVKRNE